MKLGVSYNLFDGEELLKDSIMAIKSQIDYVCVVYQTTSNVGNKAHPNLENYLNQLVAEKIVDELYFFTPREITINDREEYLSSYFDINQLYSGGSDKINPLFYLETIKREIGRQMCLKAGCDYFMSLDCDEFYVASQLESLKAKMVEKDYEVCLVKMRNYFKDPHWELFPSDNFNYVPVMYKCVRDMPFRLLHPYPRIIDPTRGLSNLRRALIYDNRETEMYHITYCRYNMISKLKNTSNADSYRFEGRDFIKEFIKYQGSGTIPMPHPVKQKMFDYIIKIDKHKFDIHFHQQCFYCYGIIKGDPVYCPKCSYARLCSQDCLSKYSDYHKDLCKLITG